MIKPPAPLNKRGQWVHHSTGQASPDYGTGPQETWSVSYASVKTPNWKNLTKEQRRLIQNPYDKRNIVWRYSPTSISRNVQIGSVLHSESYSGYLGDFSSWTRSKTRNNSISLDNLRREGSGRVLDKIGQNKINLAQAFAERRQTVDMLSKSINRLASAALAIRRGKYRHAVELFGRKVPSRNSLFKNDVKPSPTNLSNHWLEFSYGWRPLLQDVYGACEHLADSFYRNPPVRFVSRIQIDSDMPRDKVGFMTSFPYFDIFESDRNVVTYQIVVYCKVEDTFAQQASQLGLTNPLLLGWELLPYSFVVDWFLPVGDYLQRLTATQGLVFHSGTESYRQTRTYGISSLSTRKDVGYWNGSMLEQSIVETRKQRFVLSTFPKPPTPRLQKDFLGVSRSLSGLALLTQAFSGRK